MAPVRNISRVLFAVVATGMLGLLAVAFSYHQVKAQSASVKLKKDGNAPHLQKKPVFKRRLTLEGGLAQAIELFAEKSFNSYNSPGLGTVISGSFFHPSFRGPPAVVA